MSNYMDDNDKDDSRMSFVTVSSMVGGISERDSFSGIKLKKNPPINTGIKDSNNGFLMQSEIKESFEDMPLQIASAAKVIQKEILPYLIVDYKGEKKD